MRRVALICIVFIIVMTSTVFAQLPTITANTLQPETIVLNISLSFPDSSFCIASITYSDSVNSFTPLNCDSILFTPDTTFTGKDTALVVFCDSSQVCDTAMIIITIVPDYTLWPIAHFYAGIPPNCIYSQWSSAWNDLFTVTDSSSNADSVYFYIRSYGNDCVLEGSNIEFVAGDLLNDCLWLDNTVEVRVCIVAINKFGTDTFCNTICSNLWWQGIQELQPAPIQVYPIPAKGLITLIKDPVVNAGSYLELTDISGKRLELVELKTAETVFSTDHLPTGLYFLNLKNDRVAYKALKLLIE